MPREEPLLGSVAFLNHFKFGMVIIFLQYGSDASKIRAGSLFLRIQNPDEFSVPRNPVTDNDLL